MILVIFIGHLLGCCVTELIAHGDMVVDEQAMPFSTEARGVFDTSW